MKSQFNFNERYIPEGNYKFGAIEIESSDTPDESILRYRLFIEGKERWVHTIQSPPTPKNGFWDKLGRWFFNGTQTDTL